MQNVNKVIKQLALDVGFSACGIAAVGQLVNEKERFKSWLDKDFHGSMHYLAREAEKKLNPALLMENAKSIIMLAYHYAPDPSLIPDEPYCIARFALGLDYHVVLKEKMEILVGKIKEICGELDYRVFSDSAPVMEKAWAVETGIGWVGKNTLLQIQGKGSWFVLSEILLDLALPADQANKSNYCGNCRRCLDACPTSALTEPYVLDARKCLAYLTIETKDDFQKGINLHGRLYGCDICQEVCPHNLPQPFNPASWFKPNPVLSEMKADQWKQLDESEFTNIFKGSGIYRNGYKSLVRNLLSIPH